MKVKILASIILIFALIIGLALVLFNPYFNYYNKSDLDTNVFKFSQQYEINQDILNKAQNSNLIKYICYGKDIKPITETKDGSSYLNEVSIYEIQVMKNLMANMKNYNKFILRNPSGKEAYTYGWKVMNDLDLLNNSDYGFQGEYLDQLIYYIKNPNVKDSSKELVKINEKIYKQSIEIWKHLNNKTNVLVTNYEYSEVVANLKNLEYNYIHMEHGSICAKKYFKKLSDKYIKGYVGEIGP